MAIIVKPGAMTAPTHSINLRPLMVARMIARTRLPFPRGKSVATAQCGIGFPPPPKSALSKGRRERMPIICAMSVCRESEVSATVKLCRDATLPEPATALQSVRRSKAIPTRCFGCFTAQKYLPAQTRHIMRAQEAMPTSRAQVAASSSVSAQPCQTPQQNAPDTLR